MHWPGRQEKAHELLNFNFLFGQRGKLQVTMQSSSAEVTIMESQNRKRAPAWTKREVQDLITVWGEESVLSELRSSFRNAKTFVKISQGMKDRGHNRDPKQCRMKLKELRQAYQKTREANGRSGSEPQTCRFYDELHAILGGSATTTPAVLFDSFNGDGGNTEAGFGDKEDDDDEVVDSSQQASGETGFPDSQELFLTLDLEPVLPRSHPRLPPGPARWRRDLCCMCFKDHRIFSFPEASED
nr:zinc finger and SCAN domain-containing protein 32-like [Caretta caretta]